ncbi:hypothetical protein [Pseudomonas serbica]|uniref:hypothetical protein n=1 Tax=Pseudomonas serbica TaxID=2965074 RepID=UPI00237A5638|nr:hypothetical protein [Pseudomonas serbica]
MPHSNVGITQQLLDRFQPGKDAKAVLSHWRLGSSRNVTPDVIILSNLLHDGFAQTERAVRTPRPAVDIMEPSFLLKELLYRYLTEVLDPEFISHSRDLFDQAYTYRQLSLQVAKDVRKIMREKTFLSLQKDGAKAIEKNEKLGWDVYFMGDANRLLHETLGHKIRDLYFSGEVQYVPGIGAVKRTLNPAKIEVFEGIRKSQEESLAVIEQMNNKELCLRLLRSFEDTHEAKHQGEPPIYGVKTIFAYAPILIDRLLNGWSFDNKSMIETLSDQLTSATAELQAIKARFDRLQTAAECH